MSTKPSDSIQYIRNLKEAGTIKARVDDAETMEAAIRQKELEIDALRAALKQHVEESHRIVAEIWSETEIKAARS